MIQCSACQAENPPQAKYCMECAAPLARNCQACGAELPARAKYCMECAQPVGEPLPSAAQAVSAPAAYTPQHLAERIISSRGALEGERKQVTVLFADLKGSTALIQGLDPEEVHALLHPALQLMMDAVHRYEGTVNQLLGDGLMALFGAPLAHEDHAARACYAALALQDAMRQHAEQVRHSRGLELQARVGLSSGEVLVTAIGNDLHMEYTAVGPTTHLAARMDQLATPGTVRLMPETLRLVEGLVQVRPLGPIPVRGLPEPVEVYELVGAAPTRSRLQAAAARGLTHFVGRDAELATLCRTQEQAAAGHGQIVALVGEPGVGKSRLVWEFSHSHRTQGWLVLASGSVSYGKASSYLPVIDLLQSYCGIEARDEPRRVRQKLLGKVLDLDPALQPTLPALQALLDLPVDDAAWQALDPPQRRQLTLDALKRLLLRESQEQPVLLVFEDLHWIDAETQALLDSLVDSLPTARLLLLVNYRPEYEHGWHRKTYYQQLRLDPLPPASAEELLRAMLGDAAELQPLKHLLIERTEGNPFFVEESVRTLIESGVLVGEHGACRLVRPFDSLQVPATVQSVLAARIDRLAPEDKRLLQCAAVIGKDVPYPVLQTIAELSEQALHQGLARLRAAEFLYETSLFPDPEYTFKHALTHEVAYGTVLGARRRALHARIVSAVEQLYAERLTEYTELLAHHAVQGEVWTDAGGYLRAAGARAAGRFAYREAAEHLEQALRALEQLPDNQATHEQAIDVAVELGRVLIPLGEYRRLVERLERADTLAVALADRPRVGRVAYSRVAGYMALGEHRQAIECIQRVVASVGAAPDLANRVEMNFRLGQVYWQLADYTRALDLWQQVVTALPGDLAMETFGMAAAPSPATRGFVGQCLADLGDFVGALDHITESVRVSELIGQPFLLTGAHWASGQVYLQQGDIAQAIPHLERGLEISRATGILNFRAYLEPTLAHAYALSGRLAEALTLASVTVHQAASIRTVISPVRRMVQAGEVYRLADRIQEASAVAEEALTLARERDERGHAAMALHLLGAITAQADPPSVEKAEAQYHEALVLADELGMRPLAAHCHLGLGTLYQRVGRDDEARAELVSAAEQYRAMDMPFWLAKAEAAMARAAG